MAETVRITESDRIKLRAFAMAHGYRNAANLLEVTYGTLLQALAEAGVHRSTLALFRLKLASYEAGSAKVNP